MENSEFTLSCWDYDGDACGGDGGDNGYGSEVGGSDLAMKAMFEKLIAVDYAGRNNDMRCGNFIYCLNIQPANQHNTIILRN